MDVRVSFLLTGKSQPSSKVHYLPLGIPPQSCKLSPNKSLITQADATHPPEVSHFSLLVK